MTEEAKEKARQRRAAREKQRRERLEQELKDRNATAEAMRQIRDDERTAPAERLKAVEILDTICGYTFTRNTSPIIENTGNKSDLEAFAREVEKLQRRYEEAAKQGTSTTWEVK